MSRPLMQHGVAQLEDMFAKGKADPKVLKQLENELKCRTVPRAVALLAEVQAAMYGETPATPPHPAAEPSPAGLSAPEQPTLRERSATPPATAVTPPALQSHPEAPSRPAETPSASKLARPPTPTMPLEDAYKLLKVTATSPWESIEQTRRQLVQQANPGRLKSMNPERRAQVLAEARRVNAAYATLSQARSGGRPPV